MTGPFGAGTPTVLRRPAPVAGSVDLDGVLRTAREGETTGPVLLLSRCAPTAAFSRRDVLLPGYADAVALAGSAGFEPVVRPVGGHLAAYDEGAVVVHLWNRHPDPRRDLRERFALAGAAVAAALSDLGVPDVRVGPVPGEYCDGEWSVNVGGRAKLVGTGQRLFRSGFLFSAVVMAAGAAAARDVLTPAYSALDLPLDPRTVGCVEDWAPGVGVGAVADHVAARLVAACGDERLLTAV